MNKALSIIIPAYNVSEYIYQGIESLVSNPSINNYLDIIIVNDGSTDNTLSIANEFRIKYSGVISIIDKANGGHGSGLNVGVQKAKGTYLKVLDGDDWFDNEGLCNLVRYIVDLQEYPDMILNAYKKVWEDGHVEYIDYKGLPLRVVSSLSALNELHYCGTIHSMTIKTSLFKENQIKEIDEKVSYDDIEYVLYPTPYINSIVYLPFVVYLYRNGNEGQSVNILQMQKKLYMHEKIIDSLEKYYVCMKDKMTHDQDDYYINGFVDMIAMNCKIIISMKDTKDSLRHLKEFVAKYSKYPLNRMKNRKIWYLIKYNFLGYSLISKYFRMKNLR